MAEIFINHRRGDAHAARRLHDRLGELGAFIDVDMESGDFISKGILNALQDTRIFLAVIGKEWMSLRNLKRLHQKKDWVRVELLEALGRPNLVQIVPLLVDDEVNWPPKEPLPTVLQSIADIKPERLRGDSWDRDVDKLIELIQHRLAVPAPAPGGRPQAPMPRDIPFLCNRAEQEYDLAQLAARLQQTRSLVCVLHGHKWEAHAKFLTRLQQLGVLDNLFDAGDAGVGESPLEWNSALACAGRFGEMLRYAVKSGVMKSPTTTDAALSAFLRNTARPFVFTLQVTWTDMQRCAATALADLQRAWMELTASLGALPAHALILWLNVTYDDDSQMIPAAGVATLTRLGAVTEGHIQSWLNREEVKRYVGVRTTDILKLVGDARFYIEPGKMHMQQFADAVRELVDH
jgi:hypothetical protein